MIIVWIPSALLYESHYTISKYDAIVTSSLIIIIPPPNFMINNFCVIKLSTNPLLHIILL